MTVYIVGKNRLWTAYCATPDMKRGEYSEEFDVEAHTAGEARKKVQKRIDEGGYQVGMRIRKLVCVIW